MKSWIKGTTSVTLTRWVILERRMFDKMFCVASIISSQVTFIAIFINRCINISYTMQVQFFCILTGINKLLISAENNVDLLHGSIWSEYGQYILFQTLPGLHILMLLVYFCHKLNLCLAYMKFSISNIKVLHHHTSVQAYLWCIPHWLH
jgi:hypothetical protein